MKKFYFAKDLTDGVFENGEQTLPPFSSTLLMNLRNKRKISYHRVGRECVYTKEDLLKYLESTKVEAKKGG
jgi:predicted Zn-dependent peptidase